MPSLLVNSYMIAGTQSISVTYSSSAMKAVFPSPFSCSSNDRYHTSLPSVDQFLLWFFFSFLYLPSLLFLAPLSAFLFLVSPSSASSTGNFRSGRAQHNVVSLRLAFSLVLYLSVRSSLVRNCYL